MRSLLPMLLASGWDGVQSRWVLPTARKLYLIGAVAAVAGSLLALVIAMVFQFSSFRGPVREAVPEVPTFAPAPIALDALTARFAGPSNVRIEPQYIEFPLSAATVVGTLQAESGSGAASRFEIIGGRDADLFSIANGGTPRLLMGKALADQLNPLPLGTRTRPYVIRVLATDGNGNQSPPVNLAVNLQFGPAPVASTGPLQPAVEVADVSGPAALAKIAEVLAGLSAKRGTPAWFDAYQFALDEPKRCAADGNDTFNEQYVRGFSHVRAKLTSDNLATFYAGICDGWRTSVQGADAAVANALAERNATLARNAAHELETLSANAAARGARNVALTFAVAALMAFMTVALFLAFLAIEGHSSAMRAAIEVLALRGRADD